MKKLLLILLCLAAAFSANAQFVQNDNGSTSSGGEQNVVKRGANKIAVIFSPLSYKYSTQTPHGLEKGSRFGDPLVGIIYTRNQSIANVPLYLEFGGGFLYSSISEMMDTVINLNLYTLYVPVNINYRFEFGTKSYLSFFTGPYLKYNFAGSILGLSDIFVTGGAKRAQFGWQGGLDVSLGGFYLTLSYSGDLTNLLDFSATGYNVKNKLSGLIFGIGVVF